MLKVSQGESLLNLNSLKSSVLSRSVSPNPLACAIQEGVTKQQTHPKHHKQQNDKVNGGP